MPIPTIATACYNDQPLEDLEAKPRTAACHDPPMKGTKSSLQLKSLSTLYNNLGVRCHPGVILGHFGSLVLDILVLRSHLAQLLDAVLRHTAP